MRKKTDKVLSLRYLQRKRFQMMTSEQVSFFKFLISSYLKGQPDTCPYCGSSDTPTIARRRGIIQLKKCGNCALMFRYPKETMEYNEQYYQDDYDEGITTQMPPIETLNEWKQKGFKGSPRDFSTQVSIVQAVAPSGKLLDFGASWGYASYQFMLAGYDTIGYEVSRPRARYAHDHLGVKMLSSMRELSAQTETYDVIFTSHVLEHCPNLREILDTFFRVLKSEGKLVALVPNCKSQRQIMGMGFGMHHIFALNQEFFAKNLPTHGFKSLFFASSPYAQPEFWDRLRRLKSMDVVEGDELLVVATKSP